MFTIFCLLSCLAVYPLSGCVATVVLIVSNSWPLDALASCSLESRYYLELFPRFPYAFTTLCIVLRFFVPGFHRMYSLFASYRLFPLTMLAFTLFLWLRLLSLDFGRSCCTSIHDFVLSACISVTITIPTDLSLSDTFLIPQWALTYQVRALLSVDCVSEEYSGPALASLYSLNLLCIHFSFLFIVVL